MEVAGRHHLEKPSPSPPRVAFALRNATQPRRLPWVAPWGRLPWGPRHGVRAMGSGAWGYALQRRGMGLALDALGPIGRVEALRLIGRPPGRRAIGRRGGGSALEGDGTRRGIAPYTHAGVLGGRFRETGVATRTGAARFRWKPPGPVFTGGGRPRGVGPVHTARGLPPARAPTPPAKKEPGPFPSSRCAPRSGDVGPMYGPPPSPWAALWCR